MWTCNLSTTTGKLPLLIPVTLKWKVKWTTGTEHHRITDWSNLWQFQNYSVFAFMFRWIKLNVLLQPVPNYNGWRKIRLFPKFVYTCLTIQGSQASLKVLESTWMFFLLNSRPWKYLKTEQVLESRWISFHRSLKVLEFTKSNCAISATLLNRCFVAYNEIC